MAVPSLEHIESLNDEQRQPNSESPTSDLSLWLRLSLQISLRLQLGLLLRESPQGTAGLQMEPALCPTATPEL
jgi:hypothetical protein